MSSEEACANCHRLIGALEEAFVWRDNIVCRECYGKLSVSDRPDSPEEPASALSGGMASQEISSGQESKWRKLVERPLPEWLATVLVPLAIIGGVLVFVADWSSLMHRPVRTRKRQTTITYATIPTHTCQ